MNMDPETQKLRENLRRMIREFLKLPNVRVMKEMPEEHDIIIATAVADFDPKSNDLWVISANKSYARDEICMDCGRQVVMSDGMYAGYVAAQRQAKIKCGKCFIRQIKEDKFV
jgi:ribosomal protein S27AE